MTIPGGYILQPRCIDDSDIMREPPVVRELWMYLLRRVNYKDSGQYPRGSAFFNLGEIQNDLSWYQGWRKRYYSKPQLTKSLRKLYERNMIETRKATRGLYITVLNYDYYQNPNNYESNNEGNTKETRKKQNGHAKNKKGKKEEGRNKKEEVPENVESGSADSTTPFPSDDPDQLLQEFQNETIRMLVERTIEKVHLTRKCGKAQPSVIAKFLRQLKEYEQWKIGTGLYRYLEGEYYLDHKGENYALGVVRHSTARDYEKVKGEVVGRTQQQQPEKGGGGEGPVPGTWAQYESAERRAMALRLKELRNGRRESDRGGVEQTQSELSSGESESG